MKVTAIIQARMGSTRMPGKTLKDILGKPMLWHMTNRLKYSRYIEKIVIATTSRERDKVILEFADKYGLGSFAGSEEDVLDRYYQAAQKYGGETIVRVTSDCPLIDPQITDGIIKHYLDNRNKLDYVATGLSFPDGLDTEVFSFDALKKTWHEAKMASEREHVTPYIRISGKFRIDTVQCAEDLSRMRWTVDDERDFHLVSEIFNNLYKDGEIFYMKDILDFLKRRPKLLDLNKQTTRNEGYLKSIAKDKPVR
jgi:spore coat polysaccharide biosynthesis protein SpsF